MMIARTAFALALACALFSPPSRAEAPRATGGIALAEVASRVDPRANGLGDLVAALRADAAAALAAIDWGALRPSRRYAFAATVVQLTTTRTGEHTMASSCVVSASVREADTGTLLFVVEGRALAEDGIAASRAAERDALRAAVTHAVRAVPEGLRRAR